MKVLKLTSVAVALAALPLLGSCADQQESIIIAGAPSWMGGRCSVDVPAQAYLAGGSLDIRFETEYMVPLEIQNQLQPQAADASNSGTDNSEFQISGVDVSLSSNQVPDLIDRLAAEEGGDAFINFSPAVATNSISGGGQLGYLVPGIPAGTASKLAEYRVAEALLAGDAAQAALEAANPDATDSEILAARLPAENNVLKRVETLLVSIVVRARRTGNRSGNVGEIEARQFEFPVDICHGCLVTCTTCSFEADVDADGVDETITGECPDSSVVNAPTTRLFLGEFAGVSLDCPSAQDSRFVPADCA
ncbi:MAG: hypothetical protein ACRBN8_34875 [Nannocystales bacterium]